jgi:hypothetical protein
MSYAKRFLRSKGQEATVLGNTTYVSMKRSTNSTRDPGIRDAAWQGLAEADSNLSGGQVMTVGLDKYLIQSVNADAASGELAFFALKTNAVITPQRVTPSVDADNNILEVWSWTPSSMVIDAYGQVITNELRQYDTGLLDSSRFIFFVPASAELQTLDRLIVNGENLMVNDIDPLMLNGVARIQAAPDKR